MKVLLILVDGMRSDALSEIPQAQEMLTQSCHTLQAQTVFPSVTLPCHMSLFHSVDPERHGTTTNVYAPQVRPVNGLCEVQKGGGCFYRVLCRAVVLFGGLVFVHAIFNVCIVLKVYKASMISGPARPVFIQSVGVCCPCTAV